MNHILKATAAAILGLTAFGFASASLAATEPIHEGSLEAHVALVESVQRNGVQVAVNHKDCSKGSFMGFYSGHRRLLVICQDNGVPGGPMVQWTANDLDTLRHEAQHFLQDCAIGSNHDNGLVPIYISPTELAQSTLGAEAVRRITTAYREKGATDLVLLLEYEAFAVAEMNIPLDQVSDITKICGA